MIFRQIKSWKASNQRTRQSNPPGGNCSFIRWNVYLVADSLPFRNHLVYCLQSLQGVILQDFSHTP
jgi:hypothetical protein